MRAAFQLRAGSGQNLSVTNVTGGAEITTVYGAQFPTLRLANNGSVGLHYRYGSGAQTAVVTDPYLPPQSVELITPQGSVTHIAAITDSGSTTLNFCWGVGV